jgi:hypothetical protein
MVHYGRAEAVIAARRLVLEAAYRKHPERFVRQSPEPLRLPAAVWINPPAQTVQIRLLVQAPKTLRAYLTHKRFLECPRCFEWARIASNR